MYIEEQFNTIAKKLGYTITEYRGWSLPATIKKPDDPKYYVWNPLMEDGDCLRLAAALHIQYRFFQTYKMHIEAYDDMTPSQLTPILDGDILTAIRTAIFFVAASPTLELVV